MRHRCQTGVSFRRLLVLSFFLWQFTTQLSFGSSLGTEDDFVDLSEGSGNNPAARIIDPEALQQISEHFNNLKNAHIVDPDNSPIAHIADQKTLQQIAVFSDNSKDAENTADVAFMQALASKNIIKTKYPYHRSPNECVPFSTFSKYISSLWMKYKDSESSRHDFPITALEVDLLNNFAHFIHQQIRRAVIEHEICPGPGLLVTDGSGFTSRAWVDIDKKKTPDYWNLCNEKIPYAGSIGSRLFADNEHINNLIIKSLTSLVLFYYLQSPAHLEWKSSSLTRTLLHIYNAAFFCKAHYQGKLINVEDQLTQMNYPAANEFFKKIVTYSSKEDITQTIRESISETCDPWIRWGDRTLILSVCAVLFYQFLEFDLIEQGMFILTSPIFLVPLIYVSYKLNQYGLKVARSATDEVGMRLSKSLVGFIFHPEECLYNQISLGNPDDEEDAFSTLNQ